MLVCLYINIEQINYKKHEDISKRRKTMMKRSLAIVLVLVLAMSTLVIGCKSTKTDSDTTKTKTDNKDGADNTGKKEEPVELTWYNIGTPANDMGVVEDELNKYLLEKINATVKITQFDWGEYNQKMQVKVASGEPMDIMFTCSWANDYATSVSKGALLPLSDLIEKYGKGIKETLNPLFLEGAKIDGEIYALPTNKELGWQAVWIVNKELADKYDVDVTELTTLESLEPYLEKIKQNEPDVLPLALDKDSTPYIANVDEILGTSMPVAVQFDNPTKIVNLYQTEEAMSMFKTIHRYYQKGYVHPDSPVNNVGPDWCETGNFFIAKAHYQPYAEIGWEAGNFRNSKILVNPVHQPFANSGSTRGAMQGISINSEHPEKAMEFLNLLYTDEYVLNLLDYGIEGTHYEKNDDSTITLTDRAQENYLFPSFTIGNVFNTYLIEGTPADKWEKFDQFNNDCLQVPSLGFTPDLANIKNEVAAVRNAAKEIEASLYLGQVNPEEYVPKAIKKFEDAGLNKIIEELQEQYDIWLTKK